MSAEAAGNYSANVGDIASVAYSFTADMNVTVPVSYTMSGTATIFGYSAKFQLDGSHLTGIASGTVGTAQAPISFPIPSSGPYTFKTHPGFWFCEWTGRSCAGDDRSPDRAIRFSVGHDASGESAGVQGS